MILGLGANGQQYGFIKHSVREGLAQSQVRCVFQDSRGYVWAGTLGGISRFEGTRFVNFDRQDGLFNNQVSAITELADGRIAAGSVGSISIISAIGLRTFLFPSSELESSVNALMGDGETVWIGSETGLYIWRDDQITPAEISGFPAGAHVKAFLPGENGLPMLVVTREAVFSVLNGKAVLVYQPSDEEVHLFDAEREEDGTIWIAARKKGLIQLNADKTERSFEDADGLPATTMTSITSDGNGGYWLTSRFGVCAFDGTTFQTFAEKEGLPTTDIRDVCVDREGNVWFASYGSGLLRFAGPAFSTYTRSDGLSSNAVMSILRDKAGMTWLSTFDQGICRLDEDTIVPVLQSELAGTSRIWSSLKAADEALWFGSSDGLYRYDGKDIQLFTEDDSLPDRTVLSLLESPAGKIYVGTADGLAVISNFRVKSLNDLPRAPSTRIRGMVADLAGNIWLSTRDGVYRYNGTSFTFFGIEQGLPDLSTYCIEVDARNRIWVGTQAGLLVLEGSSFREVILGEEGGARTINFIHASGDRIWVGTLNGLYASSGENGRMKSEGWTHYGEEDGMRSLETNLNAVFEDENGVLWFGTPDGVVRLDQSRLSPSKLRAKPLVHLSSMLINLQSPDWKKWKVTPDEHTGFPPQLTVGYRFTHFTFYCDGISMAHPNALKYQYWLEGLEEEWEPVTTASFATFGNLPFDSFVFHVRVQNKEGVWSDEATYAFTITPPFWLRWWFVISEVLGASLIIGWFVRNKQRTLKNKRERELGEMKSRMLTLEQQSLNSSMNRHFIFNALNSIQYYINRQDRIAANRYLSDFARLIRKNLDSSQENLTSLRDEIERLELYLKLEHMRFRDKFEYHIHVDPMLDQDQVKVPAMLLQPFLENSIWHGLLPKEAHGRVDVDIQLSNDLVEFTITDNGIGIDHSLMSKSGTDSHISKGMQITGNRIELIRKMTGQNIELRGPYQLNDEQGRPTGTQVCIRIPVKFHELFEI